MTTKERYYAAHKLYYQTNFPSVVKDGHYCLPKEYPDTTTHNGLVKFMVNYINWVGGNAHSQNVVTRASDKIVKGVSGQLFTEKRYTKSSRRGIADVQGTLIGKKLQLDAKVGKDMPSDYQLKEQAKERRAQGIYEFIRNPEDFLFLIDGILYGQ